MLGLPPSGPRKLCDEIGPRAVGPFSPLRAGSWVDMTTRPLDHGHAPRLVDRGRNDVVEIERPHKVIHLLTQLIASEMVKVCVKIVHFSPFAGRSTAKMIHHV